MTDALKNYSTTVPVSRTLGEISDMLVRAGARGWGWDRTDTQHLSEGGPAMTDLGDREPFGTREGEVIAAIAAAFAPADTLSQLNVHETSATGVCLSARFTNRMGIKHAMRALVQSNTLTQREYIILWCRFAKGMTQLRTAGHLSLSLNTVATDEHRGLQTLVRFIWHDPTYVTPPRVRRAKSEAETIGA